MYHFARGIGALLCAGVLAAGLTTAAPAAPVATTPTPSQPGPASSPTSDATTPAAPGAATVDASTLADAAEPDDRPNVIVVLTDDMRADDLDHMPRTRALLAERGMEFTQALSPHPLCCPARAELLTGQYAQNNGVRHNESRYGGYKRMRTKSTIGTWFAEQGYNAGFVGKHANGYEHTSRRDPGWTLWEPITGNPTDYHSFQFFGGEKYDDDYVTTRIEEKSNAAIEAMSRSNRPFLLYSNHIAPHERQVRGPRGLTDAPAEPKYADAGKGRTAAPLLAPSFKRKVRGGLPRKMHQKALSASEATRKWAARIASLQSVDEAVESMVETLRSTGELDNTYLFFTSDNGYSLGERRLHKKNLLVEEGLRVPLAVAGPGVPAGERSDLPVTLIDLVATLADLGDVKPRLTVDGTSFARTLRGAAQPWRDTTLVQTGVKHNPRKHRRYRHKGWALRGVRTDRYTYARDVNTGERMLFDRRIDPWEMRNVARSAGYRRVVAELDRRAVRLMRCKGSACNRTFGRVPGPR